MMEMLMMRPTSVVATSPDVVTSSPSVAPTARDALLKTRPSRDSPSATWSRLLPSVRYPAGIDLKCPDN